MLKATFIAVCAMLSAPAFSQVTSLVSSNPAPKGKDPNRKVCERVEKIGSRLNVVTVCMTAREWEDLRRGHRDDLEKVQQVVNQRPGG